MDPMGDMQQFVLPNGLELFALNWPTHPGVSLGFMVHCGLANDPVGLEGLSHFVEHVASCNVPDAPKEAIEAGFDAIGGSVDLGSTGFHNTSYTCRVPHDYLHEALSLFGTMLLEERLTNLVEHERGVIREEFTRHFPTPISYEFKARGRRILYPGHWASRSVRPLGTLESIAGITSDALQTHYDTYYVPTNMSVVVVGSLSPETALSAVTRSPFGQPKAGSRAPYVSDAERVEALSETRYVLEYSKHYGTATPLRTGSYHTTLKLPKPTVPLALRSVRILLNAVLSDEIREKRTWAYDVSCGWHFKRPYREFNIDCGSLSPHALSDIEHVVGECITRVGNMSNAVLRAHVQKTRASIRMGEWTGSEVRNDAMDFLADGTSPHECSDERYIAELESITMDDVRDVLKWFSPEYRLTRLVVP